MATPTNVAKCRKDNIQQKCTNPGEVELSDALGNTDSNTNWGAEPNLNLDHSLTLQNNQSSAAESLMYRAANPKEDRNKDGVTTGVKQDGTVETKVSPVEKQKSVTPGSMSSPNNRATVNRRDEHRVKSTNAKRLPMFSPKIQTPALSPKPKSLKQIRISRTTEGKKTGRFLVESEKRVRTGATTKSTNKTREKNGNKIHLETPPTQVLHLPTGPRVQNLKGDVVGSQPTNQTPTLVTKTKRTDPAVMATKSNQKPAHAPRAQGSETSFTRPRSSNSQRTGSALLRTTTPQMTSLSPKPATQRKPTRTKTLNTSRSDGKLHGKDLSDSSGSKFSIKSSSGSKTTTVSKASTNCRSQTGSRETLDSKSSSTLTNLGSKDSLDSKTGLSSRSGPVSKSKTGSRDSLDSKTTREIQVNKPQRESETTVDSKAGTESLNNFKCLQTPKTGFNPQTSPCVENSSELNMSSGSDVLSGSTFGATQSSSKPTPQAAGFRTNVPGSVARTPISRGSSKNAGSGTKFSLDPKRPADYSSSGPVRSTSKSTLEELPSVLMLSLVSSNQSPGTSPGKSLGSSSARPNKMDQGSPSVVESPGFSSVAPKKEDQRDPSPGKSLGSSSARPNKMDQGSPSVVESPGFSSVAPKKEDQRDPSPGKSFGSGSSGPNKSKQRSPSSSQGFLDPFASSSPNPKITVSPKVMEGSPQQPSESLVQKASPDSSSQNTGQTRGPTFEKNRFQLTDDKTGPAGGLEESHRTVTDDDEGSPGAHGRKSGVLSKPDHLREAAIISMSGATKTKVEKKKKQVSRSKRNGLRKSSSSFCCLPPSSTRSPTSRMVRETATMTELCERTRPGPGEQKDVGVQVEVEVNERSASTSLSLHQGGSNSSLIGSPSCQSLNCVPPLKRVCEINMELCRQTPPPNVVPTCLGACSLQQSPTPLSKQDVDVKSIPEDGDKRRHGKKEDSGCKVKTEKPQEVAWDEQGTTWEVYGASVEPESLEKAVQSHVASKVREQEDNIRTRRTAVCSTNSRRRVQKKRGHFLCCCVKKSSVSD